MPKQRKCPPTDEFSTNFVHRRASRKYFTSLLSRSRTPHVRLCAALAAACKAFPREPMLSLTCLRPWHVHSFYTAGRFPLDHHVFLEFCGLMLYFECSLQRLLRGHTDFFFLLLRRRVEMVREGGHAGDVDGQTTGKNEAKKNEACVPIELERKRHQITWWGCTPSTWFLMDARERSQCHEESEWSLMISLMRPLCLPKWYGAGRFF